MFEPIGPKKRKGALAPLFDRLMDLSPQEAMEVEPFGFLSPRDVQESVMDEINMLLNTRTSRAMGLDKEQEVEKIGYGVPSNFGLHNLTAYDGVSKGAWSAIADQLATLIKRFEPRLKSPRVVVNHYDPLTQSLNISISGHLMYHTTMERVTFPLQVAA